ncbi:cytochrome c biogenesis protein CcdA [Candidatus Saganbacteria bacterium]|uniref:Cytochrome c biogenesis protein CcdA n=1 Tax=Candidatus Saganbacteria bacterium TaxID=2575572 RepID=A0A9D6UK78_UNCSA|nr:cytochrome c biogenesis protein CcdA [Candidatus Saganbacteria bacterium]
MKNLSLLLAFTAGLLSFFSPCVFPLIPSYISYITGIALKDFSEKGDRARVRRLTIINSLYFIAGFSAVFISLGAAASMLGRILSDYRDVIRYAGGALVVFLGLYLTDVFKIRFPALENRLKPAGHLSSLAVGAVFAEAWTPCVGPILASILTLASVSATLGSGTLLLLMYSLGLGIPFFVIALAVNSFLVHFKRIGKHMKVISFISGFFLVVVGILLLTNYFQSVISCLAPQ